MCQNKIYRFLSSCKNKNAIGFILFILLFFNVAVASAQEKTIKQLKLVIVLIRHGDRTSLHRIPTDPMPWEKQLGQLTGIGMKQEYDLGKMFRHDLMVKENFLSKQYHPDEIYVRALSLDRTLMSAQMFLLGLYPPGVGPKQSPFQFQPIPIFTAPIEKDNLLYVESSCKNQVTSLESKVYQSEAWQQKENAYNVAFKKWSKLSGENINLKNISRLEDPIRVALIHHHKIPKGFTNQDVQQIFYLYNWSKSEKFKSIEMGRLLGGNLFKNILKNINQVLNGKSNRKFILYSASDDTIMTLMSAMGVPLKTNPHYASYVVVKIFSNGDNQKIQDNRVSVIYNGKSVTLHGCHAECPLKALLP